MNYVDGYVIPVPKKKIKEYMALAKKASKVWIDHGALEYRECGGDDFDTKCGVSFDEQFKLKATETLVLAWIVYKSKAHRDSVNAKVMKDPRITSMIDPKDMPFDFKRMCFGGFKIMVEQLA